MYIMYKSHVFSPGLTVTSAILEIRHDSFDLCLNIWIAKLRGLWELSNDWHRSLFDKVQQTHNNNKGISLIL